MKTKKANRPSISVRGDTYAQLKGHCQREQISISEFTEHLSIDYLRQQGEATPVDPLQEKPAVEERGVAVIETDPARIKW
jgi:hypothetical protein